MGWGWIGVVGGIFGIVSVLGAAVAILRSNVVKTTAEVWKGEAEAAMRKADRLGSDHKECMIRLDNLTRSYEELRGDHDSLKQLVTEALQLNNLVAEVMEPPKRQPRKRA